MLLARSLSKIWLKLYHSYKYNFLLAFFFCCEEITNLNMNLDKYSMWWRERFLPDRLSGLLQRVGVLLNKARATYVFFLDLCETFGTVPYDYLISKQEKHKFNEWTTQWTRNWLDGCTQRVVIKVSTSTWRPIISELYKTIALYLQNILNTKGSVVNGLLIKKHLTSRDV